MVTDGIAQGLASTDGVESNLEAMYIGIFSVGAALVAPFGNALSCGFVTAIEFHFIKQLLGRSKKLSLLAFRKEFLMLVGSVRQKQATAGRDFKSTSGVLVWTDLA